MNVRKLIARPGTNPQGAAGGQRPGVAAGRRHHADRGRDLVAERIAEHDQPLTDLELVGVAQRERGEPGRIDREQREVEPGVAAEQPRRHVAAVGQHDAQLGRGRGDVVVGQHEGAAGVDQEAGAERDVGGGLGRAGEHRRGAGLDRRAGADRDHAVARAGDQVDERAGRAGVQDPRPGGRGRRDRRGRGGRDRGRCGRPGRRSAGRGCVDGALAAAGEDCARHGTRDDERSRAPRHPEVAFCASTYATRRS
jgi:hypothetical protein